LNKIIFSNFKSFNWGRRRWETWLGKVISKVATQADVPISLSGVLAEYRLVTRLEMLSGRTAASLAGRQSWLAGNGGEVLVMRGF
jgi:hypothetical protein